MGTETQESTNASAGSYSSLVLPPDEEDRIAALRRYNVLDTPPDGAFDRVAELAARYCNTPVATVTFVDANRIWFKATHGLDVCEVPRDNGLCSSAILGDGPYVVRNAATDPRSLDNPLVRGEFGLRFYAAAPIVTSDGYRLGTVNVVDVAPREASDAEVATLTQLAQIVVDELELRVAAIKAVDIERERTEMARREKDRLGRIARTLQQTLAPPELPTIPGVELAAAYRPAAESEVGGDFYDVFPLSDGRWAVSIGDVSGKGAEAAALTALARYTLRGAAMRESEPGTVLSAVSDAVQLDQRDAEHARHCTAILAMLDVQDGQVSAHLANGGHPPGLLISPDGVEPLQPSGPILGWMPGLSYPDVRRQLRHGDVLVLYTDGITDARRDGTLVGIDGLRAVLAGLTNPSPATVIEALRRLVEDLDTTHSDDIAVVAIGVPRA